MKKQQIKKIAATALVAFSVTLLPTPALAVSTNIVSETEGKTTLTMSQIQDLAAIYNRNNESFELQQDILELNKTTTRNSRRSLQDAINNAGMSGESGGLDTLGTTLENMKKDPSFNPLDPGYIALEMQYNTMKSSMAAAQAQQMASVDAMIEQLQTINGALDDLDVATEDLEKSMSDWQKEVRLVAEKLCLNYAQLEKTIALTKQQVALAEKAAAITEVQEKLGMAVTTDMVSAQSNLLEAQNSLAGLEESLTMLKRQINLMIGRNMGSPLEITNIMAPPIAIEPAPPYTEALIDHFIDKNYELKTLERTKADYKDTDLTDLGSDERQALDQDIKATDLQITTKKETIENNLKSLLAKIDSDGKAYQIARDKYVNEKKLFEFTKLKYERGMISQLEFMQAELALNSAELQWMQAGYAYHNDWQKYNALQEGITLTAYDAM